jgi:hypothetical protein
VKAKKVARKSAKERQFGFFRDTTRQIWRFAKNEVADSRGSDRAIIFATCFAHISKAAPFSAPKS